MPDTNPYPLPESRQPAFDRVLAYWEGLRRGGNEMPFWDDVKLSALPDLAGGLMLIDVFAKPERFRLNTVGRAIEQAYGEPLAGAFIDDIALRGPLSFLSSQAGATVEAREPTFYAHNGGRLLLPLWGDGRISMLLGFAEA